MPIPGLSVKTHSPQHWRRGSYHGFSRYNSPKKLPRFKKPLRRRFFRFFRILKILFLLCIVGIALVGISGAAFLAWISQDLPHPDKIIIRDLALSTKIYDRTGETVLYNIHGEQKRTMVELKDIPPQVIWATLTAEDRKFYQHKGISLTGIIRSLIRNITTGSKAGGSTLTQQLVKNAILTSEKTYTRKIKEIILSYQIERKFTKDQIMKMYFNEIPYGTTAYGVEAAAQTYFGKSIPDIDLSEAAILASLPKYPSYLLNNKDELMIRQQWVLEGMVEQGYITKEESETAKKKKVEFKKLTEDIIAPHFVFYVKEALSKKYGERMVEQGGLKVITTLDIEKQKMAEKVVGEFSKKNLELGATNAALVALNAKDGQVLAWLGSKDYFNEEIDGQVNVVSRPRQPGSSFKPVVYAAAFRKGYTPETTLFDVETTFTNYDGKKYGPKNYTLKEYGPVSMREALAGSLNIPAVKTIYLAGIDNVLNLAEELGYTTLQPRSRFGLSLVLGGGEVKLIEHVNAFATFAQEGERNNTSIILKVEDKDGNVLEEFKKNTTKVLETQVARQINDILSDNSARSFIFGENNSLILPDRVVATKTGTTNDYHDAWTIGYTPSLAAGVWVGNSDNTEMKRGADGSVVAAPIWREFMIQALKGTPVESFVKPEVLENQNPALNGSLKQGIKVKIDKISGKLATEYTPQEYMEEKMYQALHGILHYIDKENPRGAPPQDPSIDPQYIPWEEAIKKWAEKNNITATEVPTETDDVHIPENIPTINFIQPQNDETVSDRNLSASVDIYAKRGIQRVEYFLENKLIRTSIRPPFDLQIYLDDPNLSNGYVSLKAIAQDDVGNKSESIININLLLPDLPVSIAWITPTNNEILDTTHFPYTLEISISQPEKVAMLKLYLFDGINFPKLIAIIENPSLGQQKSTWQDYPGFGIYELYGEILLHDGTKFTSRKINVEIK